MLQVLSEPGVWGSIIASIVGSLIGGWFTYVAVIFTFKKQKENDLPAKLSVLTEIMFSINTYQKNLHLLLNSIYSNENNSTKYFSALEFDVLKSNLVFKSLSVDKKTYQIIVKAFLEYSELDYDKITVLFDTNKGFLYENTVNAAEGLAEDLPRLRDEISTRIAYYEKKLS